MKSLYTKEEFVNGGQINTMPPLNIIYSNFDWLRTFAMGDFRNRAVIDILIEKRKIALDEFDDQVLYLGDDRIFVVPSAGWGRGSNSLQIVCKYRGIEFAVNRRQKPGEKKIEFLVRGETFVECGFGGVRERIAQIEKMLGFEKESESVGEVHFCCDVAAKTSEFLVHCMKDTVVKRAKKWRLHGEGSIGGQFDTLEVGKRHKLFLRIYNKELELEKAGEKKEEAYRRCISEGEVFDDLTRVEFEVGREALQERNIDTLDDLMNSSVELLDYLVHEWFRVHEGPVDRRHTWRGRASATWSAVIKGFAEFAESIVQGGESVFKKVVREPSCVPSHTRVMKQAIGYFANYFVWMRELPCHETLGRLMENVLPDIARKFHKRFEHQHGESLSDYLDKKYCSENVPRSIQGALKFS